MKRRYPVVACFLFLAALLPRLLHPGTGPPQPAIGGAVFADGFESGDTTRWSKSVSVGAGPFGRLEAAADELDGDALVPRGNRLAVSGWAADDEDGAPVTRVEVLVDGSSAGDAVLGGERQDVADASGRPDFLASGWSLTVDTAALAVGGHRLSAVAIDSESGARTLGEIPFDVELNRPPAIARVSSSVFSDGDGAYRSGSTVRIDVEEAFGATDLVAGTVRITSASRGYDSGLQQLHLDPILYHWDTAGLAPADDYVVEVTLRDFVGQSASDASRVLSLGFRPPAIHKLAVSTDVAFPADGPDPSLVRTYFLSSGFDGPLGFGWTHTFLMHAVEFADGVVKVFDADGSGAFFRPLGDGAYASPRGDFRSLTRENDGSFRLRTKRGETSTFDAGGKLVEVRDRNGLALTLSHGGDGRLASITDASGQVTSFAYGADGRLASVTDPAGRSVAYGYDEAGDLVSFTDAGGATTTYAYDAAHHLTSVTSPAGRTTFFEVDAEERLTRVSGSGGENALTLAYSAALPELVISDALGNSATLTYDDGLVEELEGPLGEVTTFLYDDDRNLVESTDGNGHTTRWTYDGHGNVLTKTDPAGNVTTFTYEPSFHRLTSVTDAAGNVTSLAYDAQGNLTALTYPDATAERFTYDAAGRILTRADRSGRTTAFTYDARGLLTRKLFPDGTSEDFGYDARGRLASAENASGALAFAYDAHDRLTLTTYPGGETVGRSYDADGNLAELVYPGGRTLDYEYDDLGRTLTIREGEDTVAAFEYDVAGRRTRRVLENGVATTYSYDAGDRLLSVINATSAGATISSFAYTYDGAGNRLTMTTPAGETRYVYDALDRLVSVELPTADTIAYELDALGNRTRVTTVAGIEDYAANALNQYTAAGGATFTYDANGNLASRTDAAGTTTYAYDFDDRLVEVLTPVETVTFTYDALGRRSSKTTAAGTTFFLYDGLEVLVDQDGAGDAVASYVYGERLDEVLVMERGGSRFYYSHDALGSVTDVTDGNEAVVEQYAYDPYGKVDSASAVGNRYLFTGRELDQESSLYYFRARYLDPDIGRFLSVDPVFAPGISTNDYNYVLNNPINLKDPKGDRVKLPKTPGLGMLLFPDSVDDGLPPPEQKPLEPLVEPEELQDEFLEAVQEAGDPTFVQRRPGSLCARSRSNGVIASIHYPCTGDLVRAMVPVFGIAEGPKFDRYRVELGRGSSPTEWEVLASSFEPRRGVDHEALIAASPDRTVFGNLATWDTGLKNYAYGDEYTPERELDLRGEYTIRLVVTQSDGTEVEDRVTVEVGRVISNVYGGRAESPDGKMRLEVPEHAITDGFQLVAIRDAATAPPATGGRRPIGRAYACREPGERFIKPARLAFAVDEEAAGGTGLDRIGLYAYDRERETWRHLDSRRTAGGEIVAEVRELAPYYALMASDAPSEGSRLEEELPNADLGEIFPAAAGGPPVLVHDTFEVDTGGWSNRDGDVGADVRRVRDPEAGGHVLEVRNRNAGGNFAVNVRREPFDAARYPLIGFAYKVPPGVQTDFLFKVDGRWYDVRFTDDPKRYRRLGIEPIGRIAGVVADGRWHRASFDLGAMLRAHPPLAGRDAFVVEEIVMADWDSAGYMKLVFGTNPRGATYFVDDFTIEARPPAPRVLKASLHRGDGARDGPDRPPGEAAIHRVALDPDPRYAFHGPGAGISLEAGGGEPPAAGLTARYDLASEDAYAGFYLPLHGLDASAARSLAVRVRGAAGGEIVRVGIKSTRGGESKVLLDVFLDDGVGRRFARALIPLEAFAEIGDLSSLENVSFSFEGRFGAGRGTLVVDEVAFVDRPASLVLTRCGEPAGVNLRGEPATVFRTSRAELLSRVDTNGCFLYYSGIVSSRDEESWAVWTVPAGGLDLRRHERLLLGLELVSGRERPNVYLDDGDRRAYVDLEAWAVPSPGSQEVSIPLERFARQGVDLSRVERLELAFEWERMAGALYVRDVRFTAGRAGDRLHGDRLHETP